MIKQLCSYMYGTHVKCGDDKHLPLDIQVLGDGGPFEAADFIGKQERKIITLDIQILQLLNQIQELKAINHYQDLEHERKINELMTTIQTLEESHGKRLEECWKKENDLQHENMSLKEQLESSQREVSTLSGVLSSEPIMEALGKKDDGITHYDKDAQ